MHPNRVSVVGSSGVGKSTFADRLAGILDVRHVELDAIHHLPGWEPMPRDEFRQRISDVITAGGGWVIDGNYQSKVQDLIWDAADTVVFIDLPRRTYFPSLMCRTLRRVACSEELWNGNRERWRNLLDRRPEENILVWSWTTFGSIRARYLASMEDPRWAHLTFVHLKSRRQMEEWLARPVTTR